jgi:hypothetical protein
LEAVGTVTLVNGGGVHFFSLQLRKATQLIVCGKVRRNCSLAP